MNDSISMRQKASSIDKNVNDVSLFGRVRIRRYRWNRSGVSCLGSSPVSRRDGVALVTTFGVSAGAGGKEAAADPDFMAVSDSGCWAGNRRRQPLGASA
ncbi:MAG: hypothetical protein U1A22_10050 [Xanthomonadaceae bacterium]|nr:hypothetical protein [Xanthomonadaceae bacterium]